SPPPVPRSRRDSSTRRPTTGRWGSSASSCSPCPWWSWCATVRRPRSDSSRLPETQLAHAADPACHVPRGDDPDDPAVLDDQDPALRVLTQLGEDLGHRRIRRNGGQVGAVGHRRPHLLYVPVVPRDLANRPEREETRPVFGHDREGGVVVT